MHHADPDTPLFTSCLHHSKPHFVKSSDIAKALRHSCHVIGASLGITPKDISARALRNGGCMALIRGGIDPLQARLMGRWDSWAMLEYLETQAIATSSFAALMLTGGVFLIPSHQTLPSDVSAIWSAHMKELATAKG